MANSEIGLIGRKVGMTQLFEDDGRVIPVTVLEVGPCTILDVKTEGSSSGYTALQLAFGDVKEQRLNKPQKGIFAKLNTPARRYVREVRVTEADVSSKSPGDILKVDDVFKAGDKVDVTGTSKGRGFSGVVRRYHFAGFERTHGTHEFFRHGGSIGTRLTPGHVLKGKKMPGQMGNKRVTVQNLSVAKVDTERNLLYVNGGAPGPNGGILIVRQAVKSS